MKKPFSFPPPAGKSAHKKAHKKPAAKPAEKPSPFAGLRKGSLPTKGGRPNLPFTLPQGAPVAPVLPSPAKRPSVAPSLQAEPDADQRGGPSDNDQDNL